MLSGSRCSAQVRASLNGLLFISALLLVLLILERHQIMSGFNLLPGDRYDAVISTAILEHWHNVALGKVSWLDASYFFPYERTIAQTDAYFLVSIAYVPFRLFGYDPFVSAEMANITIKAIGFWGMFYFCKNVLNISFGWSLLAAIIFTLSNGMTSHSSRIQLASVAFAPVLSILIWRSAKALIIKDAREFVVFGAGAGVLFGAWCLTCFYMAWFYCFLFVCFCLATVFFDKGVVWRKLIGRLVENYRAAFIVIFVAILAISPFLYAFLPKSLEVGVRSYETVLNYTVLPEEVLQVGNDNVLLGRAYNSFLSFLNPDYSPRHEYYNTGFNVFLFLLFAFGCWFFLRTSGGVDSAFFKSLCVAVIFTWLLTVNIKGYSGWFFIFNFFPGAKALNVVAIYQIMLAFPLVLIAVKFLSTQLLSVSVAFFVALVLILSEINVPKLNLIRSEEMERISLPFSKPDECEVFYVSGWNDQADISGFNSTINSFYPHNVSAMLIAQIVGAPTINGFASFNPPDWNFSRPYADDYDVRVSDYINKYDIKNICKLDLNSKRWEVISGS